MASLPTMPLATDAYLGDTTHLTCTEHGAYLLLLMTMWRAGGSLPNDDKLLARYAKLTAKQWARVKVVLMPFFTIDGDRISQSRLTREYARVRQHVATQSDKGRASALKRQERASTEAESGCNPIQPPKPKPKPKEEITPPPPLEGAKRKRSKSRKEDDGHRSPAFLAFKAAYPPSEHDDDFLDWKAWQSLTADGRDAAMAAAPVFAAKCSGVEARFIPRAAKWLREGRFWSLVERVKEESNEQIQAEKRHGTSGAVPQTDEGRLHRPLPVRGTSVDPGGRAAVDVRGMLRPGDVAQEPPNVLPFPSLQHEASRRDDREVSAGASRPFRGPAPYRAAG